MFNLRSAAAHLTPLLGGFLIEGLRSGHCTPRAEPQVGVCEFEGSLKIRSILANRFQDEDLEMGRLGKIRSVAFQVNELSKKLPLNSKQKIAIGQVLEIQESLKDTHYIVTHGQSSQMLIVNVVTRKVMELFEQKKYENFEVLRHNVFLEGISKNRDIGWYKNKIESNQGDDHFYRTELISGDIFLGNTSGGESALCFFAHNWSVAATDSDFIEQRLIKKIVGYYFQDEKVIKKVSRELISISKDLTGGTLYAICIPKTKFHSLAYLSYPFGKPIKEKYTPEDVVMWQEKTANPPFLERVGLIEAPSIPQVRLLTSNLTQENKILIVPHFTISRVERDRLERAVENCLISAKKEEELAFSKVV